MSTNYDGLTRNTWTGTWSPSGDHPIVLDSELRGTLQSVTGNAGDRLTDIKGARLNEGMLVYVKNSYSVGLIIRDGDSYYRYKLLDGESRNPNTGRMPNTENNWTKFSVRKLEDIENVDASTLTENSVLQYNTAVNKWQTRTAVDGLQLDGGTI